LGSLREVGDSTEPNDGRFIRLFDAKCGTSSGWDGALGALLVHTCDQWIIGAGKGRPRT
jgi:hypothetical protein